MQTMKWIEMVRLGPASASPEPSPPATFENDKVRPSARVPLTVSKIHRSSETYYNNVVGVRNTCLIKKKTRTITIS